MYQEYFLQKGVLILPIVAMLSFVLSFAAILLWTLRPGRKSEYEGLGELPLEAGADTKTEADKSGGMS